ncbi:MAG: PepSY domain-containing protein [Cyclobacteriaceae bacterium]|jgi:uncharacterized iron-regulated membrane protein|nr:PepSY domain-containing protein [Cyclobacteriaceae bacterium]
MKLSSLIRSLRQFRSVHRWIGLSLVLFMLITAVTGLLLGWKKNVEALQPSTQPGRSSDLATWVSFAHVMASANRAMDSLTIARSELEKFDVRADKGIVKVIYLNHWEVQVDGQTGKTLSVAKRHSDWIERVHDGSLISDGFKLFYTNYLGWGLLVLSLTGFWLWYGPRKVRQRKE